MRMFSRHVSRELAAYADRELGNAVDVERHIGQCALCREEFEQVQFGMAMIEHLPSVDAPPAIWASIKTAIDAKPREKPIWRWAFAAAVLLTVAGIAYWRAPAPQWDVVRIEGTPIVGAKHIGGAGKIAVGEWIETDSASRAGIKVGEIGTVEVEPNTQLRVVAAKPGEHGWRSSGARSARRSRRRPNCFSSTLRRARPWILAASIRSIQTRMASGC